MRIYKTTNKINGKIYIGQDKNDRKNYFGSGYIIKNAIKKYGKSNFTKDILEVCNNEKELNDREYFWIKFFDSKNPKIGYNIKDGGGYVGNKLDIHANRINILKKISENHADVSGDKNPMYGKKHSDESKKNMSINTKNTFKNNPNLIKNHSITMKEKSKGRNNSNYNPTEVLQYDLEMNFIKEWKDLFSIKEEGFNSKLISQCCRGRYKNSHGFIWKFKV